MIYSVFSTIVFCLDVNSQFIHNIRQTCNVNKRLELSEQVLDNSICFTVRCFLIFLIGKNVKVESVFFCNSNTHIENKLFSQLTLRQQVGNNTRILDKHNTYVQYTIVPIHYLLLFFLEIIKQVAYQILFSFSKFQQSPFSSTYAGDPGSNTVVVGIFPALQVLGISGVQLLEWGVTSGGITSRY